MPAIMSPLSVTSAQSPAMVSLNSPASRHSAQIPSPTSPKTGAAYPSGTHGERTTTRRLGLLVPTDRSQEELEEKWLPRLGRFKVEREVVLQGYALYALRTWYVGAHSRPARLRTDEGKVKLTTGISRARTGASRSLRKRASRPNMRVSLSLAIQADARYRHICSCPTRSYRTQRPRPS